MPNPVYAYISDMYDLKMNRFYAMIFKQTGTNLFVRS